MTTIVFIIAEDWAFLSHRWDLGKACLAQGWKVVIATHITGKEAQIRAAGFIIEPLPLERKGTNPLRELATLAAIRRVLRRHRPDIVHAVALKPVLYGNLAALSCGQKGRVSALAGMGYAFTRTSWKVRLLRSALTLAMRLLLRGSQVIVQNDDDHALLLKSGIAHPNRLTLIPGSGVDLVALPALPEPQSTPPIFAIVSRMLGDKGILEAIEAARILRARDIPFRLWLVGAPDPENPTTLSETQLRQWQSEGLAEWLGHRTDIPAVWAQAHVALLPSHREGMPKALLEAAASGRPIITTDAIGCRAVIESGVEGIQFPVKSAEAMANAMAVLAQDGDLRRKMGKAARARAERLFGLDRVIGLHLDLYRSLLKGSASCAD